MKYHSIPRYGIPVYYAVLLLVQYVLEESYISVLPTTLIGIVQSALN